MSSINMGIIKTDRHTWEIRRRIGETGTAPYIVYRDDAFWCTADSYRDAQDEIEEAENETNQ